MDLSLVRFRDPNEAVGLAVRLLAGVAPFRQMPLGMSMGLLVQAIDGGTYAFATRPGRAVGFACWRYCQAAEAEAWLFGDGRLAETDPPETEDCAIMLAMQAIDTSVARFFHPALRDGPLRTCRTLYYFRDYGAARPRRAVRLVRPRTRL